MLSMCGDVNRYSWIAESDGADLYCNTTELAAKDLLDPPL